MVLDRSGRSVPDAVFYAEAYDTVGTFDFVFAEPGATGEVTASGTGPLVIAWRKGAKIAVAAFAPGRKPVAVYDALGRLEAQGIRIVLEDLDAVERRWEPRVAKLSFPFEGQRRLAARVSAPEAAPLRRAFRQAYDLLVSSGEPILPAEKAKLEALRELEARAAAGN